VDVLFQMTRPGNRPAHPHESDYSKSATGQLHTCARDSRIHLSWADVQPRRLPANSPHAYGYPAVFLVLAVEGEPTRPAAFPCGENYSVGASSAPRSPNKPGADRSAPWRSRWRCPGYAVHFPPSVRCKLGLDRLIVGIGGQLGELTISHDPPRTSA